MEQQHIDVKQHIARFLRQHPIEWIGVVKTVLSTLKFRYVARCAARGTIVGHDTRIINFSKVRIGQGCLIQDHVYMRAGTGGSIVLGEGVAINSFVKLFGHGGIDIGAHTQIGPAALLTTTTHNVEDEMKTSFHPISVGERTWVGANVTILSGVRIGKHCVIGAGSLVNRDLPDHSVAVGVPARVIRRRSPEESGPESREPVPRPVNVGSRRARGVRRGSAVESELTKRAS